MTDTLNDDPNAWNFEGETLLSAALADMQDGRDQAEALCLIKNPKVKINLVDSEGTYPLTILVNRDYPDPLPLVRAMASRGIARAAAAQAIPKARGGHIKEYLEGLEHKRRNKKE